ncbi:MAG: hypothetical protein WC249_04290 [Patescibacteria group bacterium]|jgi:hypothetical protein
MFKKIIWLSAVSAFIILAGFFVAQAAPNFIVSTSFPGSGIWNSSGNVGIGKTNPQGLLHVYSTASSADGLVVSNNGFVGVGTSIPNNPLQIETSRGAIAFFKSTLNNGVYAGYIGNGATFSGEEFGLYYALNEARLAVYDQANSLMLYGGDSVAAPRLVINNNNGNVGIGTTNPTTKLDLSGGSNYLKTYGVTATNLGSAGTVVVLGDNNGSLYSTPLSTFVSTNVTANSLWSGTKNGTIWNGDAGVGNVGIGTTAPGAKLDVDGIMSQNDTYKDSQKIALGATSNGKWYKILSVPMGTSVTYDTTVYRVDIRYYPAGGINTGYSSQVNIYIRNQGGVQSYYWNWQGSGGNLKLQAYPDSHTLELYAYSPQVWGFIQSSIEYSGENLGSLTPILTTSPIEIANSDQGAAVPYAGNFIVQQGNVGIGTTNPGAKLDVRGGATFTSGISLSATTTPPANFLFVPFNSGVVMALPESDPWGHFFGTVAGNPYDFFLDNRSVDTSAAFRFRTITADFVWHDRLVIKNGGNVGIGTTGPTTKLDVAGSFKNSLSTTHSQLGGAGNVIVMADNNGSLYGSTNVLTGSGVANYTARWTSPSNLSTGALYDNGTNVGIGTTNPLLPLHVSKTYSTSIAAARIDNGVATAYQGGHDTALIVQPDVPALRLIETNTGVQATQQELSLAVGDNNAVIRSSATAVNGLSIMVNASPGASGYNPGVGTLGIKILNTGYVGIGTASPARKLEVANGGAYPFRMTNGGNYLESYIDSTWSEWMTNSSAFYVNKDWYIDGRMCLYGRTSCLNDTPTSYGSFGLTGAKAGYYGILFGQGAGNANIMYDSSGNGGIYYQNVDWSTYYLASSRRMQINTSSDLGANLGVAGSFKNTTATTHSLLANSGNVVVMADNSGTLYTATVAGATKTVASNWGYYVDTGMGAYGSNIINVRVTGGNSNWNGSFLVQGENSYTPTELWNNAKLISWAGYNASVDDVAVRIMSNTAPTTYGGHSIVLKLAVPVSSAVTVYITANGTSAGSLNPVSSAGAPYTYTMTTSAGTYQIYQMTSGNVGIGTTGPLVKTDIIGLGGVPATSGTVQQGALRLEQGSNTNVLDMGTINSSPWTAWIQSTDRGSLASNYPLSLNPNGGNVGIGTTAPGDKLEVTGGIRTTSLGQSIGARYQAGNDNYLTSIMWNSVAGGVLTLGNNGINEIRGGRTNAGGYINFITNNTAADNVANNGTVAMTLVASGNVGIGTTGPTTKLDVAGSFKNSGATTHSLLGGAGNVMVLADNSGGLYAGPLISGTFLPLAGGTMNTGAAIHMSGVLDGVTTLGVTKINATTIDPLYSLNDVNYATFVSSIAGGVKEEYVGKITINSRAVNNEYEKVIDFSREPEGSDLWVWRQVVDYNYENIEVLFSPYGQFARVYYVIEGNKLIFRSDKPVTLAYRLVGRRFDWRKWPTKALDQTESGIKVK